LGSTGELKHLANVPNKIKITKNNSFPTNPIETIPLENNSIKSEQTKENSPQHVKPCGVTAIAAVLEAGPELIPKCKTGKFCIETSSIKLPKRKIIRVLLDSGSDGVLMFHEKGTPKSYPHLIRQIPKSWSTSNGIFHTKGKDSFQVIFFEYSNSKFVTLQPEIDEFEAEDKPAFDLIIGTNTMEAIGIILIFFDKVITLDQIVLPMQSIKNFPTSNRKALGFNNSLAKNQEPKSTELATQCIVEILDAKYEKENLPELVENECSHLNPTEKLQLLELLMEFEDLFDGTLGDWDTETVSFQLKEGSTPYHGRAYPIPQKHNATVKTEVKRLCEIGVLEWQAASEWATPSFIQPKEN
jgi:hypothetical protein